MYVRNTRVLWRSALVTLGVFLLSAWTQTLRADEPMLAIRQGEGESSIYAVSEIEQLVFEGDTLVVLTPGGSDAFAVEAIAQIEFLWEFSGTEGPEALEGLRKAVHLFQNRPNPFSPETQIRFDLRQAGRVELGIYGVNGRLIRTLVDEKRTAGPHGVHWDGRNDVGRKVPGGVYFYSLTAPGIEESRQMILLP